jgi:transcriptional regulator GlxA family with amidase domain
VPSDQGPALVAEYNYAQAPATDIVLVPGGIGTRGLAKNPPFLDWLRGWAATAPLVTSVCTGSGLLAAAGLLDGYGATSHKGNFAWAKAQGPKVEWVQSARWVQDGDRWTSSGVAAGMDMTLALIAHLHSDESAVALAEGVEYQWHRESSRNPFSARYGVDQR